MNDYRNQDIAPNGYQMRYESPAPLSAMAVTSLVLGIVALLTSALPIINNFSFLLAALGVIFGIVGLVATTRGTRRGKVLAIVGLVLGVVSVVVVLASQSMYSAAIDEALNETSGSTVSQNQEAVSTDIQQSQEAPSEATQQDQKASSEYTVSIDDCVVTTDYSGAAAIVVTYTFTNNSDKAAPFFTSISAKAFQNGVELDTGIVQDIDAQSTLNEIKPGAATTVQQAYLLDDQSDVSVECTELISLNDSLLAEKAFSVA